MSFTITLCSMIRLSTGVKCFVRHCAGVRLPLLPCLFQLLFRFIYFFFGQEKFWSVELDANSTTNSMTMMKIPVKPNVNIAASKVSLSSQSDTEAVGSL
jgi:hypothetical protein